MACFTVKFDEKNSSLIGDFLFGLLTS